MLDGDDRRSVLRQNLQQEITDLLWKAIKQPEFAAEIEQERLDPSRLVREVSADPALMDRSALAYEPVLNVDQDLEAISRGRPPLWERGWRPDRSNVLAIVVGLSVPIAVVWAWNVYSFEPGTITAVLPLLLAGSSLAALGFMIRNGLPRCVRDRLQWELDRLSGRLARWGEHRDWRQLVRDDVVTPFVREWINQAKRTTFATTLTLRDATGLLATSRDSPLVRTHSIDAFRRELERPDAGAIGIAGPRGVGKTTLIERTLDNAFTAADQPPFLTVTASAPARYDAREFILHLYAITCRAVLRTAAAGGSVLDEGEDGRTWRGLRRRETIRTELKKGLRVITKAVLAFAAASIVITLALDAFDVPDDVAHARITAMLDGFLTKPSQYLSPWHSGLLFQIAGVLLLAYSLIRPAWLITHHLLDGVSALVVRPWRAQRREYHSIDHKTLCALARHDLRQVRFLQTRTEGWTGKLSGKGVFELGLTSTIARAERPLTHPEIVDDYRRLLERVVTVLAPETISGVIIAIDELDKLADAAQAREFIDEIKGVFGLPRSLFLVSVSEDALSSFHRRGIPVRDSFDSAFATVIRMEPFVLEESRAWLAKRAIGVSEPFIHLCHCLSGGGYLES